jgi:thioredoxin 2
MVTVRCPFCLTLNRVDLARAADRPRCGKCERPMLLDRPIKVTQEDFGKTVLEAEAPVLVDFYADWCQPCKVVAPVVDELAQAHLGKLLVVKVDADHAPKLSMDFSIRGIPTLILYRDGAEVGRVVGADPKGLREMVRSNLASAV